MTGVFTRITASFRHRRALLPALAVCLSISAAVLLASCGREATESASDDASEPVRGGVLRIGGEDVVNLDPAVNLNSTDYLFNKAVYDYLVDTDQEALPQPSLAESWNSPDAVTWTFKLRKDVVFHDGSAFTAADAVYTVKRLMDPKVGSPAAPNFANVKSVEAFDDYTLVVVLTKPNPEFPLAFAEVHAAILPEELTNPSKETNGTGPFVLDGVSAGDRASFSANKDYWRTDENGEQLPYLDGLEVVFSPDVGGLVEALRAGEFEYVGGLTAELAETVKDDPGFKLLSNKSNTQYSISLRCDRSETKDVRVRKALRLGSDTVSLANLVRPGLSDAGNGSPIGPAFAEYYLDQAPPYDPEQAKQLLTEAGYPDGFSMTLYVQTYADCPAIATVWKEQMAQIGVDVTIKTLPPDVWYGDGEESWLKVDHGIIDWAHRNPPSMSLELSYRRGAPWNVPRWSNAEFDDVLNQIGAEVDEAKRVELYERAQEILIEENPYIVTYFEYAACVTPANVYGITVDMEWSQTVFTHAYIVP